MNNVLTALSLFGILLALSCDDPASAVSNTEDRMSGAADSLVAIPGGTFNMGADSLSQTPGTCNLQADNIHRVTLSAFMMSNTECTQGEFLRVMGVNPSYFTGDLTRPVEQVTWFDAVVYCIRRSADEGRPICYDTSAGRPDWTCDISVKGYRLPTEAEWEYACKGGTPTNFYWGNESDSTTLCANSWTYLNCEYSTHPVATKTANAFGLYDMSGNVWQWCGDWYDSYSPAAATDPTGVVTGSGRVVRGGSWSFSASYLRSAYHSFGAPDGSNIDVGFRVVLRP